MFDRRSIIEKLGYYGWKQQATFKRHLLLPLVYLKVVVRNYRDLTSVPSVLPKLVEQINKHIWRNMEDIEQFERKLKVHGVPAPYIRNKSKPVCGVKVGNAFEGIVGNVKKFMESGTSLYLHSGFEESALQAASQIIVAAVKAGIEARMMSFGSFLDEVKETFDNKNASTESTDKALKANLLAVYMIGKEYATDYSRSELVRLLSERRTLGKITLIVTHLELPEFVDRYRYDPRAVVLKFEDAKITQTVDELIKFLRS